MNAANEPGSSLADLIKSAEVRLPTTDVAKDLEFFVQSLGFRLNEIYPADDPSCILLSGHGAQIRLDRNCDKPPGNLRLLVTDPSSLQAQSLTSPGGTLIEFAPADPPLDIPQSQHRFMVRKLVDQAPWVIGRAGMHYRDLIPGRLGGSIIASHIRIPEGGPVPDMVHYHVVGFQLIYCYKGWVDVVYEDQGGPIRLFPGDCVIQPPQIRHRVLESSDELEVIEIGVPAEHITTIDHDMTLPTSQSRPQRDFSGQTFVHHVHKDATWHPWHIDGFTFCDTGIAKGTRGVADVIVAKLSGTVERVESTFSHEGDILFTFVLQGGLCIEADGQSHQLNPGDAFVIPPQQTVRYSNCDVSLELLKISLPASVLSG